MWSRCLLGLDLVTPSLVLPTIAEKCLGAPVALLSLITRPATSPLTPHLLVLRPRISWRLIGRQVNRRYNVNVTLRRKRREWGGMKKIEVKVMYMRTECDVRRRVNVMSFDLVKGPVIS